MSTIKANDIQNAAGGIPTIKGEKLIPTAWAKFNQNNFSIQGSENVSSVTSAGYNGRTYVNFTNNMANSNYAVVCTPGATSSFSQSRTSYVGTTSMSQVMVLSYNRNNGQSSDAVTVVVIGGE